ncbi:DUF2628 domain-containing protein [Brucellaceae bacterium D45D]
MAQFVVLEPVDSQNAEKAVFVRDGFHVLSLILPVVWLLFQRLWFEAAAVFGVMIVLGLGGSLLGISNAIPLITLLVSVFVALEGANWKVAKLRRQGFAEKAVIDAANLEEAEIRYFHDRKEPFAVHPNVAAPEWTQQTARPAYSSTGSTIGFVGHRGEN